MIQELQLEVVELIHRQEEENAQRVKNVLILGKKDSNQVLHQVPDLRKEEVKRGRRKERLEVVMIE
jgi:histidyl-tRNA synthetase